MASDILGFSMEAHGYPMGPHGTPWGPHGTHGNPWIFHGFSMNFRGGRGREPPPHEISNYWKISLKQSIFERSKKHNKRCSGETLDKTEAFEGHF